MIGSGLLLGWCFHKKEQITNHKGFYGYSDEQWEETSSAGISNSCNASSSSTGPRRIDNKERPENIPPALSLNHHECLPKLVNTGNL